MTWRFEPGEALGDAFRRVAAEEIAKVRACLTDPAQDRARAIHEARQGFKRLRALLRLAEPSLGAAFCDENRLWRDAGRQLSGCRDQTVLQESFNRIVAGCRGGLPEEALAVLRVHLAGDGGGPTASDVDEHVRVAVALLDNADKRVADLNWPAASEPLRKGLKRSQSRLRKNWKAARKASEPSALHDWRKRVKDQAAQLRLLRKISPSGFRSRLSDEKKTAELLGEEHDYLMLEARLLAAALPADATAACDTLFGEITKRRKALRNAALKLGRNFSSQKPKAFARELITAWEKISARKARGASDERATSQAW